MSPHASVRIQTCGCIEILGDIVLPSHAARIAREITIALAEGRFPECEQDEPVAVGQ